MTVGSSGRRDHGAGTRLRRHRPRDRRLTVESLEERRLLSRDVELILGGPDEDFGLMARTIARAADLSRYTSEQLDAVDRWVVLNPALVDGPTLGSTLPSDASDGLFTSTTTTTTSTSVGSWPFYAPESVTTVSALPEVSSDFAIWTFPAELPWTTVAAQLDETAGAGHFYPLAPRPIRPNFVPNDPFFRDQWHLRNQGQSGGTSGADANIVPAWDTARGSGVVIGIVDSGVDYRHPDLIANYREDLDIDVIGNDSDAMPTLAPDDECFSFAHGTSAAGVAAARGNNALGVSGAAPSAQFTGLRFLDPVVGASDAEEATVLSHERNEIDIYNNSWGPGSWFGEIQPLALQALRTGVTSGRNGLGNVFVFSAGNGLSESHNANYDAYANSRYTIAVSAIDDRGVQSYYSEPGAPILVAAPSSGDPSSILTTDILGLHGANTSVTVDADPFPDLDYTGTFGGTSSSAPLVSGIVALMLQANPNLTWRDVQHILVNTARKNDPNDPDWTTNGAGYDINHKYGFGAVDAAAAVNLARGWVNVGPETSGTALQTVGAPLPDANPVGITSTINFTQDLGNIEWVEVVMTTNHPFDADLGITLTSPAGTQSVLAELPGFVADPCFDNSLDPYDYGNQWTFTSVRHWGESTRGNWTLHVADELTLDEGTWVSWQLNIYTGPAGPPVAVADDAVTQPGIPVAIPVLANDVGRLDPTRVRITTPPASGTTSINPTTGVITYTPNAGFRGDDTFRYVVANSAGLESPPGVVTIAVNEAPTLRDDVVTVAEDNTITFDVLANDTDLDGTIDRASLEIITAPTSGAATIDDQRNIVYVPNANFFGTDRLVYRAYDDDGLVGTANVTINVTSVNDQPVANNDEFSANVGEANRFQVLANDIDIDSNLAASTVEIISAPATGSVAVDTATGEILYTAEVTFRGGETLTYRVRDIQGALSNTAIVRIERTTSPTALDDVITILEDFPIHLNVSQNDFDVDGHVVRSSIQIVGAPQHGRVTFSPSLGLITYHPNADYFGPDAIRYTVRDNAGLASNVATVQLTIENVDDGPRLSGDAAGTAMDTEVRIDILANDHDIDSAINPETVLIPLGGQPRYGQVTIKPTTGEITYVPHAGYQGADRFTYFVRDEGGTLSNEGVVHVRVGEPVQLGGRVFVDLSDNGIPDPGEAGIANVQVQAIFDNGQFSDYGYGEYGTGRRVSLHRRPRGRRDPADGNVLACSSSAGGLCRWVGNARSACRRGGYERSV